MDSEAQQRIVDCLEACRYFGNPAALPAVIDAMNNLLGAIVDGRHLTVDSQEVEQLCAALNCLDIRSPADPTGN